MVLVISRATRNMPESPADLPLTYPQTLVTSLQAPLQSAHAKSFA